MKKLIQILFHRVTFIVLAMLIQLVLLIGMVWRFNNYFVYFYSFSTMLSVLIVLSIFNDRTNPAYKIAWLIPVLVLPIFGGMFYLMFGYGRQPRADRLRMQQMTDRMKEELQPEAAENLLCAPHCMAAVTQSRYISDYAHCPPSQNTCTEYLPIGEAIFERMKQELEKAERYIFMEYFIVQEGVMWDTLLEILVRKAKQGVDVRIIYDDMGCIFTLPWKYDRTLESLGVRCRVFNPFRPVLSPRFNNRSHRKITVVDGHTAFTGGINLADEYINAYEKHGHWKDTGILLKGEAAWTMTVMFLTMWGYVDNSHEDIALFRPAPEQLAVAEAPGWVQPYSDNPMDHEPVGENIYMNLLYKAERYVYITTPYLIVDNEMITALCTAAKCGVDVRIITPHIADKWYVHAVTRHNYQQLIESGVRIYEYVPGFIHSKSFVVDDLFGVIGTVNLDFRSLFLHFECGVWLYGTESIAEIRTDFENTLQLCREITLADCLEVPLLRRLGRSVLAAFSPLM